MAPTTSHAMMLIQYLHPLLPCPIGTGRSAVCTAAYAPVGNARRPAPINGVQSVERHFGAPRLSRGSGRRGAGLVAGHVRRLAAGAGVETRRPVSCDAIASAAPRSVGFIARKPPVTARRLVRARTAGSEPETSAISLEPFRTH